MTDHKYTDEEVIKALELCFTPAGTTKTCAKCPFRRITLCKIERDRAALELLKRQRAEIEAWETGQKALQKNLSQIIRAEAIKEFAERLKEGHDQCDGEEDVPWLIDKIVKEMTEGKQ